MSKDASSSMMAVRSYSEAKSSESEKDSRRSGLVSVRPIEVILAWRVPREGKRLVDQ